MTLKFIRQEESCEEERESGGERAGKRLKTSLHPVPRFVSSNEIEVMESSLNRWIEELTQDVDGETTHMLSCRKCIYIYMCIHVLYVHYIHVHVHVHVYCT